MKSQFTLRVVVATIASVALLGHSSFGQDESLPNPLTMSRKSVERTPLSDSSSVTSTFDRNQKLRMQRSETEAANRALRMERARRLSEAKTELLIAQMNAGYNPHRPTVNAGYMYLSPAVSNYRWSTNYRPMYAPNYWQDYSY